MDQRYFKTKINPHNLEEVTHVYNIHLDSIGNKTLIRGEGMKEETTLSFLSKLARAKRGCAV